jgi:hypothetical protein
MEAQTPSAYGSHPSKGGEFIVRLPCEVEYSFHAVILSPVE